MKETKFNIAMDGFTAANLLNAVGGARITPVPTAGGTFEKGMTAANLQTALGAVPPKATVSTPVPPPTPSNSTGSK